MAQGFTHEDVMEPAAYLDRYVEGFLDEYEDAEQRTVEEALLTRDGPIEGLVWMALAEYSDHTLFHRDSSPDTQELIRLFSLDPNQSEMSTLRTYLQEAYEGYTELEHAAVLRFPDPYQPGREPAANVAAFYDPDDNAIKTSINAVPPTRERDILEDIGKLVPAPDLEAFTRNIASQIVEEAANWRVVTSNIHNTLDDDDNFRKETTKPLPESLHPEYGGTEAELWQKPASKVDYMNGSQGFLQLWIPVNEPHTAVIDVTSGDYDKPAVIEHARRQFE